MKLITALVITLVLTCFSGVQAADKKMETTDEARFELLEKGVVLDNKTGFMWATEDNGKDINWNDAKAYCENYKGGGFTDWQMPDQAQLGTLYDAEKKNKDGYGLATDLITITDCCPWAADFSMNGAGIFSFKTGRRPWGYMADTKQLRALPFRQEVIKDQVLTDTKKHDMPDHKTM